MKKYVMAGILLLSFFSPTIYWHLKPETTIDVTVIDKTVPSTDYREHLGLFWVLTNYKATKPSGADYAIDEDYFGYDPKQGEPMNAYNISRKVDLIYIADTYGVYSDDINEGTGGSRSQKIYGGMEEKEWQAILRSKGANTTLIGEYNSFATPTEEKPRLLMEETLGVEWSGWSGRYFDELSSPEIPSWLIDRYEAQYQQKWSFNGDGLVLVHYTDQVIILGEKALEGKVLFAWTNAGKKKFPKAASSEYPYWFDILTAKDDALVYAKYDLHLSTEGKEVLKQAGIPASFPAVIHQPENKTYYFAGDYADYGKDNLMKWERSDFFMTIFSNDSSSFFWRTYVPLMRVILDEVKSDNMK